MPHSPPVQREPSPTPRSVSGGSPNLRGGFGLPVCRVSPRTDSPSPIGQAHLAFEDPATPHPPWLKAPCVSGVTRAESASLKAGLPDRASPSGV